MRRRWLLSTALVIALVVVADPAFADHGAESPPVVVQQDCHPSYERACIPPNGEDVDCPEVAENGPETFSVVGPDVYGLDGDRDGIACESSGVDNEDFADPWGLTPSQRALGVVLVGMALVMAPRMD